MLKNLPVRLKFVAIYANMTIFTIPFMIFAILIMSWLNGNVETLYSRDFKGAEYTMRIKAVLQEERVNYRDALLNMSDAAKREDALTALEQSKSDFKDLMAQYKALLDADDATGNQLYNTAYAAYNNDFLPLLDRLISAVEVGSRTDADARMNEMLIPLNTVINTMDQLVEHNSDLALETNAAGGSLLQMFIIVCPIFIIVYLGVTLLIGRKLTSLIAFPLQKLSATAKQVALGDTDVTLEYDSRDEIGSLTRDIREMVDGIRSQAKLLDKVADGDYTVSIPVRSEKDTMSRAINQLVDNSNAMLTEIRDSASQVSSGATQIADAAQTLATGSSQQAATVQQFTAAITQVRQQAEDNNRVADETFEQTQEAGRLMTLSQQSMEQMTDAMRSISESSQNIANVIAVIDNIAFQTNILALNASVEAARAGQHGKGFAVVADEVRNLASKSAAAAKETADLIENSVREVENGNDIARRTSKSLSDVAAIAKSNADSMRQLSEASRQQSNAIAEITEGINQISAVVQANSATAEESAASAEEMSAQSALLNQIVARFRLRAFGSGSYGNTTGFTEKTLTGKFSTGYSLSNDRY